MLRVNFLLMNNEKILFMNPDKFCCFGFPELTYILGILFLFFFFKKKACPDGYRSYHIINILIILMINMKITYCKEINRTQNWNSKIEKAAAKFSIQFSNFHIKSASLQKVSGLIWSILVKVWRSIHGAVQLPELPIERVCLNHRNKFFK